MGGLICFHLFPMCSHGVPQDVPNSTSKLFYAVCPKSNSDVHKLRRWIIGEHICFYFVAGVQKGPSIGERPMFPKTSLPNVPKNIGDAPINGAPSKK